PQQDTASPSVIGHTDAGAGSEGAGILTMPGANLPRIAIVRRTKRIDQPVDPGLRVGYRRAGTRRDAKGDGLGPALGCNPPQGGRRLVQGLVPGYASPSWIGVTLRPGAAHGIE